MNESALAPSQHPGGHPRRSLPAARYRPLDRVQSGARHDRGPTTPKATKIGRADLTNQHDLPRKAISALRRLQKMPHLVRGFFRDPHLASIAAGTCTYARLSNLPRSPALGLGTCHRIPGGPARRRYSRATL
jgi:hypothetical protein